MCFPTVRRVCLCFLSTVILLTLLGETPAQAASSPTAPTERAAENVPSQLGGAAAAPSSAAAPIPALAAPLLGAILLATWLYGAFRRHARARRIRDLVASMDEFAEGALASRAATSGLREFAPVAIAFNRVADVHQQILADFTSNASALAESTVQLSTHASAILAGANTTIGQSASVAAAAEELTTNTSGIAQTADQMAGSAGALDAAMSEMAGAITSIAKDATDALQLAESTARQAQASDETLRRLSDATSEITGVVTMIRDLAEQTNLLALNATIEAARAGDAGKGFEVVANEVKELAQQTSAAIDTIRGSVERIQSATREAGEQVHSIRDATADVTRTSRSIASAVEQQSATAERVRGSVTETTQAVETVSHNVAECATATGEIAQNIARVDQFGHETADKATAMQKSSSALSRLVIDYHALIKPFRLTKKQFDPTPIKAAHDLWKARLAAVVCGESTLTPAEVASHRECEFGKWYESEGRAAFGRLQTFQDIDARHAEVHRRAREIVELARDGNQLEAAHRLEEFPAVSARLFELLDRLDAEVNR